MSPKVDLQTESRNKNRQPDRRAQRFTKSLKKTKAKADKKDLGPVRTKGNFNTYLIPKHEGMINKSDQMPCFGQDGADLRASKEVPAPPTIAVDPNCYKPKNFVDAFTDYEMKFNIIKWFR